MQGTSVGTQADFGLPKFPGIMIDHFMLVKQG